MQYHHRAVSAASCDIIRGFQLGSNFEAGPLQRCFMLGALCARRRSRSPRSHEEKAGASRAPLTALPIRLKRNPEVLAGTAAPSAPHPAGDGEVWQRSPLSGLLRAWLLPTGGPSPVAVGILTAKKIFEHFGPTSPETTRRVALFAGRADQPGLNIYDRCEPGPEGGRQ